MLRVSNPPPSFSSESMEVSVSLRSYLRVLFFAQWYSFVLHKNLHILADSIAAPCNFSVQLLFSSRSGFEEFLHDKSEKTKHEVITTLPSSRDRIQLLKFAQLKYFELRG